MIPLAIPQVGEREARNLQACVDTNFVSSVGPFVDRFEREVAERHGAVGGVATSAGTTALHLGLVALGVEPGDLVICPAFTFIASANAIAHQHASPWLMDVTDARWTLDPAQLERALAEGTERRADGAVIHRATGRRVAAVMPVYTLGTPADMASIGETARAHGLPILADAAAAIGIDHDGTPLAGLADLTAFSFNGNKTITSGGGGMLVGTDEALLKRARHLSTTARVSRDYDHDVVGFNYRMTNIQAAVGCAQMERLDDFLARKREVRGAYAQAFAGIEGVATFPEPEGGASACWFSGIVLDPERQPSVAEVCDGLRERGVEARPFWKPLHLQAPYAEAPREAMDVTDRTWSRIVTLPSGTGITDDELETVIRETRALLR